MLSQSAEAERFELYLLSHQSAPPGKNPLSLNHVESVPSLEISQYPRSDDEPVPTALQRVYRAACRQPDKRNRIMQTVIHGAIITFFISTGAYGR